MTDRGGRSAGARNGSVGMGGADATGVARGEAFDAKRSDASRVRLENGRFEHFCAHPGCGKWGAFGCGCDLRRYAKDVAEGKPDAARWLGVWWCRDHLPHDFFARRDADAGTDQAKAPAALSRPVGKQGVLL